MVDTWNGDVRLTDDGHTPIPAGFMKKPLFSWMRAVVVLTLEQATQTLQAAARAAQINPNASIASATRRKPVMFAPMM